jgi:hypothetical protein
LFCQEFLQRKCETEAEDLRIEISTGDLWIGMISDEVSMIGTISLAEDSSIEMTSDSADISHGIIGGEDHSGDTLGADGIGGKLIQ